jgi:tRNA-2-methylthio-N6-dimethylallyladenosine synthase
MNLPNLNEARKRSKKEVNRIDYKLSDLYKNIGLNKTYHVKTYGCQMNEHDTENIEGLLESIGFTKEEDMEKADVVILNTCSIRENAHNKAFGMLGRLKHLKEEKPNLIIGVCGCMAQEEVVVNEILSKYRHVNFVFGTHNLFDLPRLIYENMDNSKTKIDVFSIEGDLIEGLPVKRANSFKAYVNIIYGCDKFCTYCIVPYTRGKQRSRKMEDILKEVNELKDNGCLEVTLLGQNVNAYGKDLNLGYDLADLLEAVAKTNIPRVRFITSHPWDFTDRMIEVIKKYPNIMKYVHLPIQSGSDRILKLMGRRYTRDDYKTLFNKLKEIDGISITTDIIVGFPGEEESDFNETLDMVNYCRYDGAFTFIYSPRVGTPAAKLFEKDQTTLEEKEQRLYKLNELINNYSLESNKRLLNKEYPVLVEGFSNKEDMLFGYTETNKLVNFKGNEDLIGKIVNVKILDAKSFSLDGELVE